MSASTFCTISGSFGLAEKRLDDLPVIGVVRRICFNRQLTHRTHVFLGRDGNAERRVVAEGLSNRRRRLECPCIPRSWEFFCPGNWLRAHLQLRAFREKDRWQGDRFYSWQFI